MCGQIGRPGTGLYPLRGQNNVQGASDAGLIPMFYPDYEDVANADVRRKYEKLWGAPLSQEPGLTVVEIINAANSGEIKGMYIMGENPAMSDPDLDHARAAIAKLEHLVVQDIFLTETAMMADVVLPSSAWPSRTVPSPIPTGRCRWDARRSICRATHAGSVDRRGTRETSRAWLDLCASFRSVR